MKFLAIFLLITANCFAGYTYARTVTIDHTKVPSTQTDWPVMVCANGATSGAFGANCDATAHTNLAIPNLKTVGNGGAVTSSYDGTTAKIYVNGALDVSGALTVNTSLTGSFYVNSPDPGFGPYICPSHCQYDEMHITNTDVGADGIATSYNNESAPSSFYTFGAENVVGAVRHRVIGN